MSNKTSKQFFFDVQLKWIKESHCVLTARDAIGEIHVAMPPEFGGEEEKPWTPEHLFLSSICSCFLTTYLAFSKKNNFEFVNILCDAIGQIEVVNGKYKFTNINIYPKIFIEDESLKEDANFILEKTNKYCLISNSINATIYYHSEIIVDASFELKSNTPTTSKKKFTLLEAKEVGAKLGIDFSQYKIEEFRKGLEIELEHGKSIPETNITNDDTFLTAKIAWVHLHEIPDYYTRLEKMEKEAEI